jgi:hypothetical protein
MAIEMLLELSQHLRLGSASDAIALNAPAPQLSPFAGVPPALPLTDHSLFRTGGYESEAGYWRNHWVPMPQARATSPISMSSCSPPAARMGGANPALFVSFVGRAKLARKPPVRAERDEARGFLAPIAAQDLLHRAFQVVVPEEPKNATEKIEGVLVGYPAKLLGQYKIASAGLRQPVKSRCRQYKIRTGIPTGSGFGRQRTPPLVMYQPIVLRWPARLVHGTCDDAAPRQTSLALGDRLESRNVVLTLLKYGDQRLSSESDLARLGRTLNEVC